MKKIINTVIISIHAVLVVAVLCDPASFAQSKGNARNNTTVQGKGNAQGRINTQNAGNIQSGVNFQRLQDNNLWDIDGDGIPNGQDPDFVSGTAQGRAGGMNFIDENGDGVCDYFQMGSRAAGNAGMNMMGTMRGRYYVDANGDGVCDNFGSRMGQGMGNGRGRRLNFIDQNGDGICDRFQGNAQAGTNFQRGRGKGGRRR